jgi:PilZ domain
MQLSTFHRRAVRRAIRTRCHAVELGDFHLIGERVLDLSPRGMLVACDDQAKVGDDVMVSFRAPGSDGLWLDAEAVVARVIEGLRPGDPGYCMGLDFTYFEKSARDELLTRLVGFPPPVPQRRLRSRAARGAEGKSSVVVAPVITLWDEPVFPLVTRKQTLRSLPKGAFSIC